MGPLPSKVWHGAHNLKAANHARRKVNKKMGRIIRERDGTMVSQPGISYGLSCLFRLGGLLLSLEGFDIYLANVAIGFNAPLLHFIKE